MDELKRFFNDEHDRSLQKRHEDQQKLASLQQTNDDLLQNLIDLKTMWAEQQLDSAREAGEKQRLQRMQRDEKK